MDLPIIIFHLGYKEYVSICLLQALKYNKNVILITDVVDEYNNIDGATIIDYNKYNKNATNFKKWYIHLSTNSPIIELLCIIRWMIIYEYMYSNNIERAFICDSDVLIYDNITQIDNNHLYDKDFMLCSSPSKNITGGQSIWSSTKLH